MAPPNLLQLLGTTLQCFPKDPSCYILRCPPPGSTSLDPLHLKRCSGEVFSSAIDRTHRHLHLDTYDNGHWACFDQVTLWNQIGYSHKEHPSDKSITYKDWNSRKVLVPFFSFRKSHQPLMWCRKVNLLSLRRNWSIFSKNCIFWKFVGILCRA